MTAASDDYVREFEDLIVEWFHQLGDLEEAWHFGDDDEFHIVEPTAPRCHNPHPPC